MKRVTTKKTIGIQETVNSVRDDNVVTHVTPVDGLSHINPFENTQDKSFNIANFIVEYSKIEKSEQKLWEMIIKYNLVSAPIIGDIELRLIFDSTLGKKADGALMSFSELMVREFPKARYAIEPFFESGTMNMVSAPPNTWKSWLLFYFSYHMANGTELFGHTKFPTEKSKIMIINEEDSYRLVQDRFRMLGITDTSLEIYFRIAQGSKLEEKFIDKIIAEAKEKEINVVIFDSLRSVHNADENDSTAMQTVLDLMKRVSREGITVIFTHHHRKKGLMQKKGDAESSRGSSAINAAISGHISLEEDKREDGTFIIVEHLKSKVGEKLEPFEIKVGKEIIEGETKKITFEYDGAVKSADKRLNEAKTKIISIMREGEWKTRKDLRTVSIGDSMLRNALKSLEMDGAIVSISRDTAIKKFIPVSKDGKKNEKLYSLNTEGTEYVTLEDEQMNQEEILID